MFYHVKELQFNARVSKPDVRFAKLLLEQFGGGNGELKAAMQYFVQAFGCKKPYPDKYDLLMDIATEEFSHLEIVGATISGGGPTVTDSQGIPWSGAFVNAMGDLTVDLRSDIAAEARAKMVYENLLKFTADPLVKETLRFLMTREVAHFQMFQAALESIPANFPPGILQSDPRHSNSYFNLSNDDEHRGPWNEGQSPQFQEEWKYIDDPIQHVHDTMGLLEEIAEGTSRTEKSVQKSNKSLSAERKSEVDEASGPVDQILSWSTYLDEPVSAKSPKKSH